MSFDSEVNIRMLFQEHGVSLNGGLLIGGYVRFVIAEVNVLHVL